MVLSFLLMGWGNKNHSLFLFHHPVSWKAWYFYLHCPRQCHVSMPFPWEFRSQRASMTEANTRNPVPFWLQARYTFRSTSHPSWKQTWGRSCFPKRLVARRLPAHSVHAPGQQHIPTDWTTHTWKTRCAQKKDSFFLFVDSWRQHFHSSGLEGHDSKQAGIRPSIPGPPGACLSGPGLLGLRVRKLLAARSTGPSLEKQLTLFWPQGTVPTHIQRLLRETIAALATPPPPPPNRHGFPQDRQLTKMFWLMWGIFNKWSSLDSMCGFHFPRGL